MKFVALQGEESSMKDSTVELALFADTHGDFPAWNRPVTAVLHAGDIYDAPSVIPDEWDAMPGLWIQSLRAPVFAVRGNHDHHDPGRFFSTACDVSGSVRKICPQLYVAGVGLSHRNHFDLPTEQDLGGQCDEVIDAARRMLGPNDRLLLLTHYPPKIPVLPIETVPAAWTFEVIANLVRVLRPVVIVQGHVHEWAGRRWFADDCLIITPQTKGEYLAVAAG
jgi:Icc-related predicted phosphoesterase